MKGKATRRSSRTAKQNVENTQYSYNGRSRSSSTNETQKRGAAKVNEVETSRKRKRSVSSSPPEKTRVPKRIVDGRIMDSFCWVCHRLVPSDPNSSSECLFCPRVYHKDCLKKLKFGSDSHSKCECQLKSVDGKNENLKFDPRELKKMLQSVMQEAIKEDKKSKSHTIEKSKYWRLFRTWPENEDNDSLCKIMDLAILIDNMNGEDPYLSTAQFFSDVKWIYHNCCLLYGSDCDISETALKLEKNFKLELTDMEACTECYQNKYAEDYLYSDYFTKVCRTPHTIIWAKLRGSPFWPAKCLKVQNGHVEVRFFGTHDKSNIMMNKCFLMSAKAPNNRQITQSKYQDAMQELKIYINNYEKVFGKTFHYYPCSTPLGKGSASPKKGHRKGRRKSVGRVVLNESLSEEEENSIPFQFKGFKETTNSEAGSAVIQEAVNSEAEISDVERKMSGLFQYAEKLKNIGSSQTMTESTRDVDVNSDMVYHMTFTAEEHNVPASELNNPDEFVGNSSTQFSTGKSINPSHPLPSQSETSLSSLQQSDPYVTSSENIQNPVELPTSSIADRVISLNPLPVITSAVSSSSSEIASNISAESSTSSSLPVITATMSTCPEPEYTSSSISVQSENVEMPMNGQPNSAILQSFPADQLASIMNAANSLHCLYDDDDEDDCTIITEKDSAKEETIKRFPPGMLRAILEIMFSQNAVLKKQYCKAHEIFSETFITAYFQAKSAQDVNLMNAYVDLFRKACRKIEILKKTNSEAASKIKELQEKIEKLETVSNQKRMLKEYIIKVASENIQKNNYENEENKNEQEKIKDLEKKLEASESRAIEEKETLIAALEKTKEKLALKEEELAVALVNVEKRNTEIEYYNRKFQNVKARGVQTEAIYFNSPEKDSPNTSTHTIEENLKESMTVTTTYTRSLTNMENRVEDQQIYEGNSFMPEPMYMNSSTGMPISSASPGLFMAPSSSGLMMPSLSTGMIMPNPSSGMTFSNPSTGMTFSNPSTGMTFSNPSTGMTFSNPSSGITFPNSSPGINFSDPSSAGMILSTPSLLSVVMNPASSAHQNAFLNTESSSSVANRGSQAATKRSVGNATKSSGKRKKK